MWRPRLCYVTLLNTGNVLLTPPVREQPASPWHLNEQLCILSCWEALFAWLKCCFPTAESNALFCSPYIAEQGCLAQAKLILDWGLEPCVLDWDVIWLSKWAYFHPRLRVYTLPTLEPLGLCDFLKLKRNVYNFITLQYAQTLDHILYNDKFVMFIYALYILLILADLWNKTEVKEWHVWMLDNIVWIFLTLNNELVI